VPNFHLDTNVCIDLIRGRARGRGLPDVSSCRISAIVEAELWTGVAKSSDPASAAKILRRFLDAIATVSFDSAAGESYGELRGQLERDGTPIGALDQLIAAQARSAGVTLLTANLREFERVEGLKCRPWA
jgi:tRNA(fMet)-specific endonuclease VapC